MPAHTSAQTPFLSPLSAPACLLCDVCPLSEGQQPRLGLIPHNHTRNSSHPMHHPLCMSHSSAQGKTGRTRSLLPSHGMSHTLSNTQSFHGVHSATHH